MNLINHGRDGTVNLQATLSSSSSGTGDTVPHHPITCLGDLRLESDGHFSCEHSTVPPGDVRAQLCIDHSVALLLIELSLEL